MNFLVRTYGGKCITRPDTTFNKNKEDYYVPDDVTSVGWTPFAAARISRAIKMADQRFVGRYWDAVAFGVLLYPAIETAEGTGADAASGPHFCIGTGSCFDRTTMLPLPLYNICTLESADNRFGVSLDGKELFNCGTEGIRALLEDAICECTLHTTARLGDYVFRELAPIDLLCRRLNGDDSIRTGTAATPAPSLCCNYCGERTLDIRII